MSTGLSYVMAYGLCIGLLVSYFGDASVKVRHGLAWPAILQKKVMIIIAFISSLLVISYLMANVLLLYSFRAFFDNCSWATQSFHCV